jgi:hypothetical protein
MDDNERIMLRTLIIDYADGRHVWLDSLENPMKTLNEEKFHFNFTRLSHDEYDAYMSSTMKDFRLQHLGDSVKAQQLGKISIDPWAFW